jgi:hypothetical protein
MTIFKLKVPNVRHRLTPRFVKISILTQHTTIRQGKGDNGENQAGYRGYSRVQKVQGKTLKKHF